MSDIARLFEPSPERIIEQRDRLEVENAELRLALKRTKAAIQDASFEICKAASLMQSATSRVNLAAQKDQPYDADQWFGTLQSLTNAINIQMDLLKEMVRER